MSQCCLTPNITLFSIFGTVSDSLQFHHDAQQSSFLFLFLFLFYLEHMDTFHSLSKGKQLVTKRIVNGIKIHKVKMKAKVYWLYSS